MLALCGRILSRRVNRMKCESKYCKASVNGTCQAKEHYPCDLREPARIPERSKQTMLMSLKNFRGGK